MGLSEMTEYMGCIYVNRDVRSFVKFHSFQYLFPDLKLLEVD